MGVVLLVFSCSIGTFVLIQLNWESIFVKWLEHRDRGYENIWSPWFVVRFANCRNLFHVVMCCCTKFGGYAAV